MTIKEKPVLQLIQGGKKTLSHTSPDTSPIFESNGAEAQLLRRTIRNLKVESLGLTVEEAVNDLEQVTHSCVAKDIERARYLDSALREIGLWCKVLDEDSGHKRAVSLFIMHVIYLVGAYPELKPMMPWWKNKKEFTPFTIM